MNVGNPVPTEAQRPASARTAAATAAAVVRVLRPYQWTKNLLVFVPLAAAHRIYDPDALLGALRAFVAFSLVASAVYVLNDVSDVESDRRHPRKKGRSFASGALPLGFGYVLIPVLVLTAALVARPMAWQFRALVASYVAANLAYSFLLKRILFADVLLLAWLYTARVFAGGFATATPVSEWLASFSIFLFLSLALLKRTSELVEVGEAVGRGYEARDRDALASMGTSAGYLAVLVLALYVSSEAVRRLYPSPRWLWGLCPLVLYWVSALWIRARRGEVNEDPVLYAIKHRTTWVVGALAAVVVYLATRGGP